MAINIPIVSIKANASGEGLIQSITTDKSIYAPGSTVNVTVQLYNQTGQDVKDGYLQLSPLHLCQQTQDSTIQQFSLASGGSATFIFTWQPPQTDYQGYMLLLNIIGSDGSLLDTDTVAVDVSSSWVKYPRYGYVWDYSDSVDANSKVEVLKDFHINALQYYDWEYRHQKPVSDDLSGWQTWSGKYVSGNSIRNYIQSAKSYNIVNMAYNMIYAVTGTFSSSERAAMGLYYKSGNLQGQPFTFNMGTSPTGDNMLYFMNPLNTQWQSYIFGQQNQVFTTFGFDGWHGDSIGEYGQMTTQYGGALDGQSMYNVKDTYTQFLNNAKTAIGSKYLTFNPVGAQGVEKANQSNEDVIYAEIWPWDNDRHWHTYNTYAAMKQLIDDSYQDSNGKSLVVAAYINYNEVGSFLNPTTALLADATAYASGGSRIELGNGQNMLSHEYFPNDTKLHMSPDMINKEKKMYDFIVAYENLLRDGTTETNNPVSIFNYASDREGSSNSIWYFTKKTGSYECLHMINLLGTDNQWRDADNTKNAPTAVSNIPVKYYTNSAVNSVWFASPDSNNGMSIALPFTRGQDSKGSYISFTAPSLEYWDMIYFSSDNVPVNQYKTFSASNKVSFYGKDCVGNSSWVGNYVYNRSYANMDPDRYVQATTPSNFTEGEYSLTLQSCGNIRDMAVNATVNRTVIAPSGGAAFAIDQMKTDTMSGELALKAGDVIRITAPSSYSGSYGWLKAVTLTNNVGSAVTFNAKDYVGNSSWVGTDLSGNSYANLDPGRYVEITLPSTFATGTYSLNLTSCGNERPMQITVTNNRTVTSPSFGTGFSFDQMREDTMADNLILAAGDVIRITAPSGTYSWLSEFYLTPSGSSINSSPVVFYGKDCVGNSSWVGTYVSNCSYANMDPNRYVQATIPSNFTEGEYSLTLQSCGNIRDMAVTATVNRTVIAPSSGAAFAIDQMKTDTMSGELALKAGDVIRITAPSSYSGSYGWLKAVTLTNNVGSAVTFNAKDYVGNSSWVGTDLSGNSYANLDPGRYVQITLPSMFATGTYLLSLTSCGNERPMQITVTNNRTVTSPSVSIGFSFDQMREDTMTDNLILAAGDVIRITAPSGTYSWLNKFYLTPSGSSSLSAPSYGSSGNVLSNVVNIEAETGTFSPAGQEEIIENTFGDTCISGFQNITASYTLPADLVSGEYQLSVRYISVLNYNGLVATVNGISTTTAWQQCSLEWDWSTVSNMVLGQFYLEPGDIIQLYAVGSEPYLQIDYLSLTPVK